MFYCILHIISTIEHKFAVKIRAAYNTSKSKLTLKFAFYLHDKFQHYFQHLM